MKHSRFFTRAVLLLSFPLLLLLGGCAMYPIAGLYTDVTMPFHPVIGHTGSKRGEACSSNILGLIATGEGGIDAARRKGGITKVATVDHKMTTILGLYSTFCTVVTGN